MHLLSLYRSTQRPAPSIKSNVRTITDRRQREQEPEQVHLVQLSYHAAF